MLLDEKRLEKAVLDAIQQLHSVEVEGTHLELPQEWIELIPHEVCTPQRYFGLCVKAIPLNIQPRLLSAPEFGRYVNLRLD